MPADVTITSNAPAVKAAKDEAVQRALEKIGLAGESYAKLNLERKPRRVDTGRLRNSISHTHDEDTAYIGTNVEYAPYVEFGTVKMEPSMYLHRAVSENIPEYQSIFEAELRG